MDSLRFIVGSINNQSTIAVEARHLH